MTERRVMADNHIYVMPIAANWYSVLDNGHRIAVVSQTTILTQQQPFHQATLHTCVQQATIISISH